MPRMPTGPVLVQSEPEPSNAELAAELGRLGRRFDEHADLDRKELTAIRERTEKQPTTGITAILLALVMLARELLAYLGGRL